ncbi:MAG: hypothetical protein AB8C02_05200, partial [Halioglobus sp.]
MRRAATSGESLCLAAPKRAFRRRIVAGALCVGLAQVGAASVWAADADAIEALGTSFDQTVVAPDDTLVFQVNRLPEAAQGELRLVLGRTDVSAMLSASADANGGASITFTPGLFELPEGSSQAKLYHVDVNGRWVEVGQWAVRVARRSSFTESEITPSLVIGVEGQLDEGHSGDAQAPKPRTYQDGSLQAGLQSRHVREDLELRSSWNFTGASRNEKTLRFSEKEDSAYNVDLVDFLLELQKGDTHVSAGHVSYGRNPLL